MRSISWGAYENVLVSQIVSAEGAKLRLPKARSPSRLGGLCERCKHPSGSGAKPQKPTRFLTFYAKIGSVLGSCKSQIF